ncbi:MAG: AraC family transcriptional regulator [Proteobacteria bacterium]|nr:AraC family transcriptional regulator [Pseudomonadota bacterium]MDA0915227.1 AraC family transcriptional regulator [Pseudomonadota bacterium]MDA1033456.1 AraC family transcriptional regulator [Pseudomonadota bacterium]
MGNPYTIDSKLKLWSGRPDALSRDYDPDNIQPWNSSDGLRLRPAAWAAEGYREITDIADGFSVVIGDITHLEDALQRREGQNAVNFHFRLSGMSTIEVEGGEPVTVGQQTLIVLLSPAGIAKTERFFSGEHEQSVTLCCEPDFILRRFETSGGELPKMLQSCLEGEAGQPIFASTTLSVQMAAAVRALIENEFERDFRRIFVEAKALELLLLSLVALSESERRLESGYVPLGKRDCERIDTVREILDRDYLDPPSITQLARQVAVNDAKLMQLFKQQVGETIFNYTQRLKMEHAKHMLEDTEESITEIAFDVGYEYSSNFTTAFKRHFGITPKAARQAVRSQ